MPTCHLPRAICPDSCVRSSDTALGRHFVARPSLLPASQSTHFVLPDCQTCKADLARLKGRPWRREVSWQRSGRQSRPVERAAQRAASPAPSQLMWACWPLLQAIPPLRRAPRRACWTCPPARTGRRAQGWLAPSPALRRPAIPAPSGRDQRTAHNSQQPQVGAPAARAGGRPGHGNNTLSGRSGRLAPPPPPTAQAFKCGHRSGGAGRQTRPAAHAPPAARRLVAGGGSRPVDCRCHGRRPPIPARSGLWRPPDRGGVRGAAARCHRSRADQVSLRRAPADGVPASPGAAVEVELGSARAPSTLLLPAL